MIAMTATAPIFIAGTLNRCVADFSDMALDAADADGGALSRCTDCATSALTRLRGRMTVTSEASNGASDIGEWPDASPEAGCDDGSMRCCTPQNEQNRAVSTIELSQF